MRTTDVGVLISHQLEINVWSLIVAVLPPKMFCGCLLLVKSRVNYNNNNN